MIASAQCNGTWSPSPGSSYVLSWVVSDDGLSVDFNVSVTTAANTWVAVGFSATQSMVRSCTLYKLSLLSDQYKWHLNVYIVYMYI